MRVRPRGTIWKMMQSLRWAEEGARAVYVLWKGLYTVDAMAEFYRPSTFFSEGWVSLGHYEKKNSEFILPFSTTSVPLMSSF